MKTELFEAPFNLAGESQSPDLTAEGAARAKAEAEAIARKAQLQFGYEPYTIKYRCGCIETIRQDTFPQPRERQTYVDYDCSNCHY